MICSAAILSLTILLAADFHAASSEFDPATPVQDGILKVIDLVDLPGDWNRDMTGTGIDDVSGDWYLDFRETWIIPPGRPAFLKRVDAYFPRNDSMAGASVKELREAFADLIRQKPARDGMIELEDLSYEFFLLDPHAPGSGNRSFPEPDSMDQRSRKIQEALIGLIERQTGADKRFDLDQQLLSVIFHESWNIDLVSLDISKRVHSLTPVIWQRRQTVSGEPVDDAETGFPVYYKNELEPIRLRNQ